jgi:hypothetical protein
MAARFNRHVPVLCSECGKPLCVREKMLSSSLCAWDEYLALREEFEQVAVTGGLWAVDPSTTVTGTAHVETFWISEGDLFGP